MRASLRHAEAHTAQAETRDLQTRFAEIHIFHRFAISGNARGRRAWRGVKAPPIRRNESSSVQRNSIRRKPCMPTKTEDLHGNAPDKSDVALLLIDVINDLEFEEGDQLLKYALPMARQIAKLKAREKEGGIPVIYVNDNFGRWRSDFNAQVEHCLKDGVRGRERVRHLMPEPDGYFVLQPKHSGFFS